MLPLSALSQMHCCALLRDILPNTDPVEACEGEQSFHVFTQKNKDIYTGDSLSRGLIFYQSRVSSKHTRRTLCSAGRTRSISAARQQINHIDK
ncbi:hypothetical protein ACRRTK_021078 [Alexandromys fortis]